MSSPKPSRSTTVSYEFRLQNGQQWKFHVQLLHPDMRLVPPEHSDLPEWTSLVHHQCRNCPLSPDRHPRCPVAVSLVDVIAVFKDCVSVEPADISIRTEAREYRKTLPVQYGISSLMGLLMVTSGCPILDRLRPMALTHLPFASPEETLYRAMSMYLLAQYFRGKHGLKPDWELKDLVTFYEDVAVLNQCFSRRLLSIKTLDANLNALVNLDCFASFASISITENSYDGLDRLFSAYLEDRVPPEGGGA